MARVERPQKTEAVKFILDKFKDEFPDSIPKKWLVDTILRFYKEYFVDNFLEGKQIDLFGIGKINVLYKMSKHQVMQYYIKFKVNNHLLMRFRQRKGTATPSELKQLAIKKEFTDKMWQKRMEWMAEHKKGGISDKFLNYKKRCDESIHS